MNFLAHFYLSGNQENIILGNFMGDFVKGNPFKKYPKSLASAIQLHRQIDVFTDSHPMVKESIQLIRPICGKYAGVVSDMFYDHLLAKNWKKYHSLSLPKFSTNMYKVLQKNHSVLPERAQQTLHYMVKHNWLVSYADIEGMRTALSNLERRIRYNAPLGASTDLLEKQYEVFESHFLKFFPDLQLFVKDYIRKNEIT